MKQPDFDNIRLVLDRKRPKRPTLFELFLNPRLHCRLTGVDPLPTEFEARREIVVRSCAAAGYDYAVVSPAQFAFPRRNTPKEKSVSLNDMSLIHDRASFAAYAWPDPDACDFSGLDRLGKAMPAGMKIITCQPNGLLENVVGLVGFEDLCLMLADDPGLAEDVFDAVGTRLLRFYQNTLNFDCVGAAFCNDDWGFATQTMLSPEQMRHYVFPWIRKFVATIHAANRPAILHSCGQLEAIMDEIIDDLGFDGKHSYEDKIYPVEEAYERWGRRIAILGGIDVDFVCRATPAAITARSKAMLERSDSRGGYALGTGNSVPEYVPDENYFAMIRAAETM